MKGGQRYTRMFVAPHAVLCNELRHFPVIQVTEPIEAEVQRSDSQVASALPDFAGKPRICVVESRVVKGELAGARAPLAGLQRVSYICETKDDQCRAPNHVHREENGTKCSVAEQRCGDENLISLIRWR